MLGRLCLYIMACSYTCQLSPPSSMTALIACLCARVICVYGNVSSFPLNGCHPTVVSWMLIGAVSMIRTTWVIVSAISF